MPDETQWMEWIAGQPTSVFIENATLTIGGNAPLDENGQPIPGVALELQEGAKMHLGFGFQIGTTQGAAALAVTTLKGLVNITSHTLDLTTVFEGANPTGYSTLPAAFSIVGNNLTWTPTATGNVDYTLTATTDDGEETVTLRTVCAVPTLIPVFGQSQFLEHESSTPAVEYPGVYEFNSGTVTPAISPIEGKDTGFNMAMGIVELLSALNPNEVYLIVHEVVGGTGLDDEWLTDGSGVRYNALVNHFNAAQSAYATAATPYLLGAHGGAAGGTFTTSAEMRDAAVDFRNDFCSDVGIATDTPYINGTIYNPTAINNILNAGLIDMIAVGDNVFTVDWRTGLSHVGDSKHLTDASKRLAAQRTFDALTASTVQTPVLTEAASALTWAWPTVTDTDAAGTFTVYNPTAGRQAKTVYLEVALNGGAYTTTTATYPTMPTFTATSGDAVTARLRIGMEGGGFTPYSTVVSWTHSITADPTHVGNISNRARNYDVEGDQTLSLTLPAGVAAGDVLVGFIAMRTSNANNPTITGLTVGGVSTSLLAQDRDTGNAVAAFSYALTASDVTAGSVSAVATPTSSEVFRSEATGAVYRGGTATASVVTDDSNPSSTDVAVTDGFAFGACAFIQSDTGSITGVDSTLVAAQIESGLSNVFVAGVDTTRRTATRTVVMSGFTGAAPYFVGIAGKIQ